jgi:hypothetical protein
MLKEDVKIYNAAKYVSAPKLPLREELDFVGVECIYEPKKKRKKRLERLRRKMSLKVVKQRLKAQKGNRSVNEKMMWSILNDKDEESEGSDSESFGDSTTSSLTMNTFTIKSPDNTTGERTEEVEYNLFSKNDDAGMPTLTFSEDEIASDDDIDDMTISIVALVGNEDHGTDIRPGIIFTDAANEESTKWWFERNNNSSHGEHYIDTQDDIIDTKFDISNIVTPNDDNISQTSCLDDLSGLIDCTHAMFCPAMKKFNLPNNYDLKLKVDYDDSFNLDRKKGATNMIHMKLSELDDFLKTNEKEDKCIKERKDINSSLTPTEERNKVPLNSDDESDVNSILLDNSFRSCTLVGDGTTSIEKSSDYHSKISGSNNFEISMSTPNSGLYYNILELRNAQLVKYQVVKSTLKDSFCDKDEVERTVKNLMSQISSLEEKIQHLKVSEMDNCSNNILDDDIDDDVLEVEKAVDECRSSVLHLINEFEADQF